MNLTQAEKVRPGVPYHPNTSEMTKFVSSYIYNIYKRLEFRRPIYCLAI